MNKSRQALHTINTLEQLAKRDLWINHIHPLSKLITTVLYIFFTLSIPVTNFYLLFAFSIYLIIISSLSDITLLHAIYKVRFAFIIIFTIGIFNPIFDRTLLFMIGSFPVTHGLLSMCSFIIKGTLAILASYYLSITTRYEDICYALRCLHVPKIFVTIFLLCYRYIRLIMEESERMFQAYQLRAPGQRGIHHKVWGSFLGILLLRCIDRSESIYQSMSLRGYTGEYFYSPTNSNLLSSLLYCLLMIIFIAILRFTPLLQWVGSFFV